MDYTRHIVGAPKWPEPQTCQHCNQVICQDLPQFRAGDIYQFKEHGYTIYPMPNATVCDCSDNMPGCNKIDYAYPTCASCDTICLVLIEGMCPDCAIDFCNGH
jgi:hypothetical protein